MITLFLSALSRAPFGAHPLFPVAAVVLCCLAFALPAGAQERFSLFVPTDEDDVKRMLKLAGLRDGDMVYDLGSGDGRIVLEAARQNAKVFGRGVEIGEDSVIHPHVVLREGVRLGRRVIVHAGAVLGADGFGYIPEGGRHAKIPQVGGVIVEDDVEIGANTTVDRATFGATVIRRGSKIDNLVQIAHNVEIGEDCIVASQTGIAGSSRLGHHVILGGQVGIGDHVTIGDGAMMAAKSGTAADLDGAARYGGIWARPLLQWQRIWVAQGELPSMATRLRKLERRLAELEARLPEGGGS